MTRTPASAWATAPTSEDWTEVLTACPDEGQLVHAWPDGHAPVAAALDGNDWLLRDGRRIPVSMADVWQPLPQVTRRTLHAVQVLQEVAA